MHESFTRLLCFLLFGMKIVAATTPTGIRMERQGDGSFAVTKSNSALHPFLRGMDGSETAVDRLTRPYAHSVWVMRAIKRVAEPIAAVDLQFFTGTAKNQVEYGDEALAQFWKRPALDRAGSIGFADFLEATVGWLKLKGESFWILGDDWITQRFAQVTQRSPFIIARPDRMRPVLIDNALRGWEWTDANGKRHPLVSEQVVHLKFWNPYDDLRGLAEWEAARVAGEADYLAGKFKLNIMRNNGDTGPYIVAKGGMPSDEQQLQIVAAIREKRRAAARGDFRPMFLTGDVAIEDPKINSPDAEFIAGRLQDRHEVFIAFGVPPSMADLVASYSVGQASDRYMLITETCMPLSKGKIADGIEAVCARMGLSLTARFAWDEHPVMQQVREQRTATAAEYWDRGMPWRALSDHFDLGLPEFEGDDIGYIPFNVQAVGAEEPMPESDALPAEDAKDQVTDEPTEEDAQIKAMLDCLRPASSKDYAGTSPDLRGRLTIAPIENRKSLKQSKTVENSKRQALWKKHMQSRAASVKRTKSKLSKVLMGVRGEVLAKIARAKGFGGAASIENRKSLVENRAAAADFMFDLDSFKTVLKAEMRKAAQANIQDAGEACLKEVGSDDVFSMAPKKLHSFLAVRDNRMSDVAEEIFERIKRTLGAGADDGDSMDQLATRIRSEFNAIDKGRAQVVALTETSAAYGVSRQSAMEQAGVESKQWLVSGLPNTRETHLEADGQIVGINETFEVGADQLMHPGDPNGSPAEVINCHCVSIASNGEEESGEDE